MFRKLSSSILLSFTLIVLTPSVSQAQLTPTHEKPQFKALLFTKAVGWHHQSLAVAVQALQGLAEKHHFELDWNEASYLINEENLNQYDVVIFCLTTGDILNEKEQAAMEGFIRSGKGYVGIHSASDTEYTWPWYTKLVGRMFHIHPQIQTAKIEIKDHDFPGLSRFPEKLFITDEWYEFGPELSNDLEYLITVDESTFNSKTDWGHKKGEGMGDFHPISWYQNYDGGRSFYTALGHVKGIYSDDLFLEHVFGGIYWAATGRGLSAKD